MRWAACTSLCLLVACSNELVVGGTGLSGGTGGSTGTSSTTGDTDTATSGSSNDPVYRCDTAAQLPSSIGCQFVAGLHEAGGVVLVNMGAEVATVTVSDGQGGSEDEVEIEPGDSDFFLWSPPAFALFGGVGFGVARYIESDQPLQAWQFNPPTPGFDNDASILLPVSTLGTRYRIASYTANPIGAPDQGGVSKGAYQTLIVHGIEDATTVTITLTAPAAEGVFEDEVLNVAGGAPQASLTLDRGQTLIMHDGEDIYDGPPQDYDWTGSLVESDKQVAVYVSSISSVPWDFGGLSPVDICCQDSMAAAVPPTDVLGDRYAAVKTVQNGVEYDVFRVVANQDGTEITVSGDESQSFSLAAGEFGEFRSKGAVMVEGNHAFLLAQYLTSSQIGQPSGDGGIETYDCGFVDTPGDPGMNILFGIDNWLDDYLFVLEAAGVGGGWCNDHATITSALSTWQSITLSGEPLPEPTPIGNSGFGYVRVPLPEDVYRLRASDTAGVQLDIYGFRDDGSYIYPGGVRLEPINPVP